MSPSAHGLCEFIDASPSPFHVCATVAQRLLAAGFTELAEGDAWPRSGDFFIVRAGSLVAWRAHEAPDTLPFRIVGAHTDSPNLRVKQHPDRFVSGWQVVALAPYGGAWLNSWLDRDLGISGRLSVRTADGIDHRLVRIDSPILRVPQLAIHLADDRKALSLDPQRHVNAVWGVGTGTRSFLGFVAEQAGMDAAEVLGFDLMTHDLTPSTLAGVDGELLSAARLDNQCTCYAGLEAFLAAEPTDYLPVLALFDHEEVGSQSDHGAQSELLPTVLERITLAAGGGREEFLQRLSGSMVASGDMAHATHPNYPERHEPYHLIEVNAGPVLKVQPNLRYATDGRTAAAFALACRQAGVPLQRYEHRADLPCGSTIGPMTSARTGIPTVDVGAAQLAMHSAREVMGADDVAAYSAALQAFLAPEAFLSPACSRVAAMTFAVENITFDTTDPEKLAGWWARAIDGQLNPIALPFFVTVTRPEGPGLAFQKVDDPTPGKNRVHIDFGAADVEAEVKRLVELGASETSRGNFGDFHWVVLADPDGNAFCVAPAG